MKFLLFVVLWCLLFAVCWPVALGMLVLLPLIWLIAIPFRVALYVGEAILAFARALLFLPARLFGHRAPARA